MTAFAAIVAPDERRAGALAPVISAVEHVYRTPASTLAFPGCTLIAAPRSPSSEAPLAVDHASGVTAVGQAVLEDRSRIASDLGLPPTTAALDVCAAAVGRWRGEATRRLNGEFAFAAWSPRDQALISARDGLGLRPLFVAETVGGIVLGNSLVAVLAGTRGATTLDCTALVQFLVDGVLPADRTPYASVTPLPAGHTLALRDGNARLWRHWMFPLGDTGAGMDGQEVLEGYRSVLQAATRDRLPRDRASILLSGGIDSATIAAAARAAAPQLALRAFTVTYTRVPGASELPRARMTADALDLPLTTCTGDRHAALEHLGAADPPPLLDEPALTDWREVLATTAAHADVVLYGEDGDALFEPPAFDALMQRMPLTQLVRVAGDYLRSHRKMPYLGLRIRERLRLTQGRRVPAAPACWLTGEARRHLAATEPPRILGRAATPLGPHPARPGMQHRLTAGVPGYLAAITSPEVTRARLELRCPLLDTRVLRFVAGVPPIPWCQEKALAREAFAGVLPLAVRVHPKRGLAGLDEALAPDWWGSGVADEPWPEPLDAWIDRAQWRGALQQRRDVGAVWRVLQLAAWLRRGKARTAGEFLCTA